MVARQEIRLVRFGELLIQARKRLARTDGLLDAGAGLRAVEACPDDGTRSKEDNHNQKKSDNAYTNLAVSRYFSYECPPRAVPRESEAERWCMPDWWFARRLPCGARARLERQVQTPTVQLSYVLRGEVADAQCPVAMRGLSYQRCQGRAGNGIIAAYQIVFAAA